MALPFCCAAADVEDDLAERRAHLHLDQAGVLDMAGEGEDLGALALVGALGGEPVRARCRMMPGHVRPGLDVVEGGRLVEVAALHGVDVLGPGSPTWPSSEAISAVDSPQTKAPPPRATLTSKLKPVPRMLSPEQAAAPRLLDGVPSVRHRQRDTRCAHTRSPWRAPMA